MVRFGGGGRGGVKWLLRLSKSKFHITMCAVLFRSSKKVFYVKLLKTFQLHWESAEWCKNVALSLPFLMVACHSGWV